MSLKKNLKTDEDNNLASYAVDANNKDFEFWQRDSLAIHLFTREVAYQKLDYTHILIPVRNIGNWQKILVIICIPRQLIMRWENVNTLF